MEHLIHRQRDGARGGFTLLEMLIALSILGFGLLAVVAMQIQAMEFGRRARHQTLAAAIAQNRIEELQRRPWVSLAPTSGWTGATAVNHIVNNGAEQIEMSFRVSWRIANLVADQTRTIDVRVNWDDVKRSEREYALSGIRYNR